MGDRIGMRSGSKPPVTERGSDLANSNSPIFASPSSSKQGPEGSEYVHEFPSHCGCVSLAPLHPMSKF